MIQKYLLKVIVNRFTLTNKQQCNFFSTAIMNNKLNRNW